jgi:hypothetical protein
VLPLSHEAFIVVPRGENMSQTTKAEGGMGHWFRILVFFLTAGFAFPHALTENMDLKRDEKK